MQAQASTRRQHSLRTSKSRASFIESIAAIHLDSSGEASPNRPRRNTSDGVVESESRLRAPSRKPRSSSIVNLPGHFQISLKNNSDSEHVEASHAIPVCILDGKKNRRFTYVAPTPRVDQHSDNSPKGPTLVTMASHHHSHKISILPPPPSRAHPICRPSSKKIYPVETFQRDATNTTFMPASPRVCKKYNPKEYKEKPRCYSPVSYTIGDMAQSSSHMMIETCPQAALIHVCQLKTHDFAFVKRSDGSWTYAILAGHGKDIDNEEVMLFVINEKGCTKAIKKRDWSKLIRRVAKECNEYVKGVPQIIIADRDANDNLNCSQLSDFLFLPPPINV